MSNESANKSKLTTPKSSVKVLKELEIDIVSLANNHIHDAGTDGILRTINVLNDHNIGHVGAGENLAAAAEPYVLNSDLVLLGYCQQGPAMQKVQLATDDKPGVNPLTEHSVRTDLEAIPDGTQAILLFHWGREHVWTPPREDVELARRLLSDNRVATIIGSHAHRPQGTVTEAGKRAYMCLGSLIFPNYYLAPPIRVQNDPSKREKQSTGTSRVYHPVRELTYKKRYPSHRLSLAPVYDSEMGTFEDHYIYQDDDDPVVQGLSGRAATAADSWNQILSQCYRLPAPIYSSLADINHRLSSLRIYLLIAIHYFRQYGFVWCLMFVYLLVRRVLLGPESLDAFVYDLFGSESD